MSIVKHRPVSCQSAIAAAILFAATGHGLAIEFGNINVEQINSGNAVTSVNVFLPSGEATTNFFIAPGSNRGDFNVQIGASVADDAAGGILITSISQNGRDNSAFGDAAGTIFATSAIDLTGGGYFIPVFSSPGGAEHNTNVAAAYFDFASGWLAGHARNGAGTNGGPNDVFNGTPGLTLGAHFIDDGGGRSRLYLPGVNALTDGILLVNGAKNEDNYALSRPITDASGSHFQIAVHDNGTDGGGTEQDHVAFAYVPLGTENATLGRILGNRLATVSQGEFAIQNTGTGLFRLTIAGESPTSGTLIVTPEGLNGNNVDNIVTYEADGNGWVIQSRDLTGLGLQNMAAGEGAFNFVFLPFDAPPTAPGNRPTFNPDAVGAATINITEFNPNNGAADMYAAVSRGTAGMFVQENNRGDNTMGFGAAPMTVAGGVLLGTINEFNRDNSGTGGLNDYGVISIYRSDNATPTTGNWVVGTAAATALPSGIQEHNINFATAYFPHAAGFQAGLQLPGDAVSAGVFNVPLVGLGDSRTSGVLMANAGGNEDNFATAQPTLDGSGWTVHTRDNNGGLQTGAAAGGVGITYAFLPYGTENLVAGQVNPEGHLHSRAGAFELTREGTGLYRLTIDGQTPNDGMLLLTPTHNGGSQDNILVYRADGNSFLIQGIHAQNTATLGPSEDTDFQFAYLSYNNPVANPQLRVFDNTLPISSLLNVRQNDALDNPTSVSVNTVGSDFFTISGGDRGDYAANLNGLPLQLQDGILMATVRQHGTGATVSAVHNGLNSGTSLASNFIATGAEANQQLAATFFSFAGGFLGAHVDQDGNLIGANNNPIPDSSLTHTADGLYRLTAYHINSGRDGLLFAINGEDNAAAITAAVMPGYNHGWTIGRYGAGGTLDDGDFSLLYLPISTADLGNLQLLGMDNLVGGRVDNDGNLLLEVGDFSLTKGTTGEYLLSLAGATPLDGTLLLTGSGLRNGSPDDSLFSYEALGDDFLIQARGPDGNLRDAQFVFAFNSFANPLTMNSSDLVIPEPASIAAWCVVGAVALGACGVRLRRRTSNTRQP